VDQAIYFYRQQQYAKAQQLFEKLMTEGSADCLTCYYAALSNRMIGNEDRALVLFKYVESTFPGSQESKQAEMPSHLVA
jgi:TolA-binding protein